MGKVVLKGTKDVIDWKVLLFDPVVQRCYLDDKLFKGFFLLLRVALPRVRQMPP